MKPILKGENALRRLFASFAEDAFCVGLGVADPPLIDYLVELLLRFVRVDAIRRFRDTEGRRLEEVAELLMEAEERQSRSQREIYRHIGDVTLFWTGVYPESLTRRRSPDRKDHLIDYFEQGKRSYYLASTFSAEEYKQEAPILRRLSRDFELCTYGLNRVRNEWEKCRVDNPPDAEWN